jgi:hypothetical protein
MNFAANNATIKSVAAGFYATDAFTDQAVEQIRALGVLLSGRFTLDVSLPHHQPSTRDQNTGREST